MTILGDQHNFGKCVRLCQDGRIFKPRNLFWEVELLSAESRLRKILEGLYRADGINFFKLFPNLNFWFENDNLLKEGYVENLQLSPLQLSQVLDASIFEFIGQTIALLCWMGIGDLHRENVTFGCTHGGEIIFAPLDVESVFGNFSLPSQTLLLSSPKVPLDKCGLYDVLKIVDSEINAKLIAAVCYGYLVGLVFLEMVGETIEQRVLKWKEISEVPIRIYPRSTAEYRAMRSNLFPSDNAVKTSVSDAERIQLQRGDIPFFFRKLGHEAVYCYENENAIQQAILPPFLIHQVNAHMRIPIKGAFPPRNLETLKKAGVLQLARFFMKSWRGTTTYKSLVLRNEETFTITWNDTLKLQCAN